MNQKICRKEEPLRCRQSLINVGSVREIDGTINRCDHRFKRHVPRPKVTDLETLAAINSYISTLYMKERIITSTNSMVWVEKMEQDGNCFINSCIGSIFNANNVSREVARLFNRILIDRYDEYFPESSMSFPMDIPYGNREDVTVHNPEEHITLLGSDVGDTL